MTETQDKLLANYTNSAAELTAMGFEKVSSRVAGIDSGSVWSKAGCAYRAEIKVHNNNEIRFVLRKT